MNTVKLMASAFLGAVGIWLFDSALDAFLFQNGTFRSQALSPEPHESLMRVIVITLTTALGFIAVLRSRQKKAENVLSQKDELLRMTSEMAKVGGWEFDAATMKGTWTDEAARIHELPPEKEMTVELALSFYTPAYRMLIARGIEEAIGSAKPFDLELEMAAARGAHKWVRTAGFPVLENGKVSTVKGIFQDITERKQAQEALRESKEQLSLILHSTAEGIYGLDMAGNCTFCNAAGVRILGYGGEQDLLGKNIHGLMHHTRADGTALPADQCPAIKALISGAYVHSDTELLWRADGTNFPAEYWAHPIRRDDGVIGAVVTFIDITEHRKLEDQYRQAQKMEAVGQLAGGVAHDFNNIISAIIGYGHLSLMQLSENDPVKHYIDQILQSSERATTLTQSLLAFSRKQVVKKEPLKLNSVIGNFEKFMARLLREDIELKTRYSGEEPTILADRGQIEQVIMNLVTNARDAMPAKGTLTIETGRMVQDESFVSAHGYGLIGEYAMITVSDTGGGMDAATKRRIFEPFFTTKGVGKGTGLGMAMVYGIVKSHDGFINVYSEPGKGTVFHIYLPLVRTSAPAAEPIKQEPAPLSGGSETILLAEDDAVLRKMTDTILKHMGYTVITAENGREAVEKFIENSESIRLVILDGIMPTMNGKEAYQAISALVPGVRCIFMSGYAEDVFTKDGVLQEDVEYLSKPVMPSVLLGKVREVLDQ
jgi:PAS domain S-box-containing protein